MGDDRLEQMRARVAHCRKLAAQLTEPKTIAILRQMADEAEADLKRLEEELGSPPEPKQFLPPANS